MSLSLGTLLKAPVELHPAVQAQPLGPRHGFCRGRGVQQRQNIQAPEVPVQLAAIYLLHVFRCVFLALLPCYGSSAVYGDVSDVLCRSPVIPVSRMSITLGS